MPSSNPCSCVPGWIHPTAGRLWAGTSRSNTASTAITKTWPSHLVVHNALLHWCMTLPRGAHACSKRLARACLTTGIGPWRVWLRRDSPWQHEICPGGSLRVTQVVGDSMNWCTGRVTAGGCHMHTPCTCIIRSHLFCCVLLLVPFPFGTAPPRPTQVGNLPAPRSTRHAYCRALHCINSCRQLTIRSRASASPLFSPSSLIPDRKSVV